MFNPRHESGPVFNEFKPLDFWIKMILLLNFHFSESCQLSVYPPVTTFWRTSYIILPFEKSLKFGFLVQHFATFFFDFSVWFLKIEFNLLPDLLSNRLTIIEIRLLYGGEQLEAKICRFLTFLTRYRCLLNRRTSCLGNESKTQHLKYWFSSFNPAWA